ncbi:hypothetical protein GD604_06430 [Desulfolutivibrio sulfoxidireducens]|nr:hypothetical protein GD604_06430 [Desulfolutivibrio sulfoxidireducens]
MMLTSCVESTIKLIDIGEFRPQTANEIFLEGCRLYEKDPLAAIKKFEQSYSKDNTFVKGLTMAAWGYLIQGHIESDKLLATEYYRKCAQYSTILVNKYPNNGDGYLFLETISNHYHDYRNAISYAIKLINISPSEKFFIYTESYQKIDGLFSLGVNYGMIQDYEKCFYYLKMYVSKYVKSKFNSDLLVRAKDLIPQVEAKIERDRRKTALAERSEQHEMREREDRVGVASEANKRETIEASQKKNNLTINKTTKYNTLHISQGNRSSASSAKSASLLTIKSSGKVLPENAASNPEQSSVVPETQVPISTDVAVSNSQEPVNVMVSINIDAAALEDKSEEAVLRAMLDQRMLVSKLKSYL